MTPASFYGFDLKHFCRLLSYDAKTYTEGMHLMRGDHVYLGKYNNRAVSWKVLDVKDGKALLITDEALESSCIAGSRYLNDWAHINIGKFIDIDDDMYSFIRDDEKGTGKCFFMTDEMVERYMPEYEDRACYYRMQAWSNSTDNAEFNHNQRAPWWLLSHKNRDDDNRPYVETDGEIYVTDYHCDFGIRPAMYVKTANY